MLEYLAAAAAVIVGAYVAGYLTGVMVGAWRRARLAERHIREALEVANDRRVAR